MIEIYNSKEKWLESRFLGIGGSEASAVVGLNPYLSNQDLYDLKLKITIQQDISQKPYVVYGHKAEQPLVELFKLDYPQYEVVYNDNFMCFINDKYSFLRCTPDAILIDIETQQKGALEIKTTEVLSSMHREKWDNQVPENYYCQVLQYFITNEELQFVWLKAQIKSDFGDGDIKLTTKHYYFTRENCKDDIEWLKEKEIIFWQNNISKKVEPPLILPNII